MERRIATPVMDQIIAHYKLFVDDNTIAPPGGKNSFMNEVLARKDFLPEHLQAAIGKQNYTAQTNPLLKDNRFYCAFCKYL